MNIDSSKILKAAQYSIIVKTKKGIRFFQFRSKKQHEQFIELCKQYKIQILEW